MDFTIGRKVEKGEYLYTWSIYTPALTRPLLRSGSWNANHLTILFSSVHEKISFL